MGQGQGRLETLAWELKVFGISRSAFNLDMAFSGRFTFWGLKPVTLRIGIVLVLSLIAGGFCVNWALQMSS